MNEIAAISAVSRKQANFGINDKVVSFRAKNARQQKDEVSFMKEYDKEKKKAKRDKNISMGLSIFMAAAFAAFLGITLHQTGVFGKKVQKAVAKDLTNDKTFKDLALGDELKKETEEIKLLISRRKIFAEKGINGMQPIFLYSEPGAGKNAWSYALAKDLDAKFYEINVLKFNDMYYGQSENNILKSIANIGKEAKKNPNQLHIAYFDEIDSVALKDDSVNKEMTNKLHNAFKTGFNELLKIPNVLIIGSSNKACKEEALTKLLDEAIMNRFGKKIFVPLPNSRQLQLSIENAFAKIKNSKYIDSSLLKDNPDVKKLCDYLSRDGHHISFRDIEGIITQTVTLSEKEAEGAKITIKHLKEAVLDKANQLNWSPSEIEAFARTL